MAPAAKQVSTARLSRAGVAWALLTVAIWGMWSVYTRLGLIRSLHPEDLVALRFGISGLLLLPMLVTVSRGISRSVWIEGVLLAACQGAPFVLLLAAGLVFAPANHAPALTTGLMPLFAAVLSFLFFGKRTDIPRSIGLALIICGAFTLAGVNFLDESKVLFGDLLFVGASVMATIYTLRAGHLASPQPKEQALSVSTLWLGTCLYTSAWLTFTVCGKRRHTKCFFRRFTKVC